MGVRIPPRARSKRRREQVLLSEVKVCLADASASRHTSWGCSLVWSKAPDCQSGDHGFKSRYPRVNTKRIGNTSEAAVLFKCVSNRWEVLQPFGDVEPYDLVISRGNGFERVQVKTGRYRNGCVVFNTCSIPGRTNDNTAVDYRGRADLFGVYCEELGNVYLVPVGEVGVREGRLRVDPAKNNQATRLASTFEI